MVHGLGNSAKEFFPASFLRHVIYLQYARAVEYDNVTEFSCIKLYDHVSLTIASIQKDAV